MSHWQSEVDGVGGSAGSGTKKGVEVERFVEPFLRNDNTDRAGGTRDGGGKTTCAEGWTIDEEEEFVGCGTTIRTAIE